MVDEFKSVSPSATPPPPSAAACNRWSPKSKSSQWTIDPPPMRSARSTAKAACSST